MKNAELVKKILDLPLEERLEVIDAILDTIEQEKDLSEEHIDALALKRKMRNRFNEKYLQEDGSINYQKLNRDLDQAREN